MITNCVLKKSYLLHFDGNDNLVANMPMNEVIDYRFNRSKSQMPKSLLTNAMLTWRMMTS